MLTEQKKKTSKKHKIRNILLFYYLAPLIILLNASSIYFYFTAKDALDQELGKRLTTIASFAAMQVKDYHLAALETKDPNNKTYVLLKKKFEEIQALNTVERMYIFNRNSESLLDTDPNMHPGTMYERHRLYATEIDSVYVGHPVTSVLFQGKDGQYYKTAFAPIVHQGKTLAAVGLDGSADFFSNLNNLGRALTYFGLSCVLLIVVSSLIVSRKIVHPVEELVSFAERIGDGKLHDSVNLHANNELGFLAYAMEEMRKKIIERDTELQMMLQGVAHEVRNPLGGMELFSGLLKEEITDPKALEHVSRIQSEIQNLKNLVQEFLDFARKPSLEMGTVPLREFFEDAHLNFSEALKSKNCRLYIDVPANLTALFDSFQMRRVWMNLIQNAIQAIKQDGEIFCKAEVKEDFLILSIRDTGAGISQENISHIFNPFFTTKDKGSGLGLAFASKIVAAHGGKIEVESSPEQGTTFYILLPA